MIARRRRRPRIRSASYRTLFWLVRIEATFNAFYPDTPRVSEPWLRKRWLGVRTETRDKLATVALRRQASEGAA